MQTVIKRVFFLFILGMATFQLHASKSFNIYIDSDFSQHKQSAQAIEAGVKAALDSVEKRAGEYQFNVVIKDHRGNSVRSKRHLKQFLSDEKALAMIGGLHSPPLIKNQKFINQNKVLTLVPWAAAGPITRSQTAQNWVFRLSIDDTLAGQVISEFATQKKQCKQPHLLLEKTPWGDSNYRTMSKTLALKDDNHVTWFNWGISQTKLAILLRGIKNQGADCILFVGNSIEGKALLKTSIEHSELALPIYSHWGITGGNFHEVIPHQERALVDLHFIQSCYSFLSEKQNPAAVKAKAAYQKIRSDALPAKIEDLSAPTGFIHAYDLTLLLIAAMEQATLTDDIKANRQAVKDALENLNAPVSGLLKTYKKPFSPYIEMGSRAHEALNANDYCMGRYNYLNQVVLD